MLFQEIMTSLSFFQFMVNLEQSRTWISDTWSVILTLLLIATAYLMKSETELKNLKHSSHMIALSKGTIFAKKALISSK